MKFKKIEIETKVKSNIKTVWDAWTKSEHITKWNFASNDWCCPSARVELKVGGKYVARMEAKDGSFGFDFGGVYTEVEPEKKITLKLNDTRVASTTFEVDEDKVVVSTIFDAEKENSEEMQKSGWQAILNNFKNYVEGLN